VKEKEKLNIRADKSYYTFIFNLIECCFLLDVTAGSLRARYQSFGKTCFSICRLKTVFLVFTTVRIQYLSLTSVNKPLMFTCGLA